jgi:hypothetical protein
MALRLRQPKVYPDEKLNLTIAGVAMRELKAYQACAKETGQQYDLGWIVGEMIRAFCASDKTFRKWKTHLGPEQLDALLYPDQAKKPVAAPSGVGPNGGTEARK